MNAGTKSWDELSPRVQNCVLRDFGALESYFNDNPIIDSTLDYEEIYDLIFYPLCWAIANPRLKENFSKNIDKFYSLWKPGTT